MKFNLALLAGVVSLCSIPVQAQYFSQGWKPGQAVPTKAATANPKGWVPGQNPTSPPDVASAPGEGSNSDPATEKATGAFDINNILVSTLNRFGFNLSVPATAENGGLWDERIPRITDDNYNDLIVNENFESEEEAEKRAWVLVITSAASNKAEAISQFVDKMFDSAYNITQLEGDLPHIKWGRIDYFNVTYITTKWNIWQAPYLVIAKDRGQTLRFYRPTQIRVKDEALREFLKTEGYNATPPWTGLWAPGGEREWILDIFAIYMTKAYNVFIKIPKVILYLISGGLGSLILSFMHRPSKVQKEVAERKAWEAKEAAKKAAKAVSAPAAATAPAVSSPVAPKPSEKAKGKRAVVADSSTERSVRSDASSTSPIKTRSSTRQRKARKATQ